MRPKEGTVGETLRNRSSRKTADYCDVPRRSSDRASRYRETSPITLPELAAQPSSPRPTRTSTDRLSNSAALSAFPPYVPPQMSRYNDSPEVEVILVRKPLTTSLIVETNPKPTALTDPITFKPSADYVDILTQLTESIPESLPIEPIHCGDTRAESSDKQSPTWLLQKQLSGLRAANGKYQLQHEKDQQIIKKLRQTNTYLPTDKTNLL